MEIQMWKEILTPYDLAVEELQIKFNHIVKEYRQAGVYSPIDQYNTESPAPWYSNRQNTKKYT